MAIRKIVSRSIGVDVIVAEDIAAGAITVAEIANDAVTADKLADSINTSIATGVAALPKAGGTMTGELIAGEGVVETGGALKENLLTNSGFDVWSNSTLETTGSDIKDTSLVPMNGSWVTSSHSGGEVTSGVFNGGGGGNPEFRGNMVTVVGRQYKLTTTITHNSGTPIRMYVGGVMFASGSTGTHTYSWIATSTETLWQLLVLSSSSVNFSTSNTSVYDMTPGCVAANNKACDGWMKEGSTSIFREHNGAKTKDGSFYSLKVVAGSAGDYLIWTGRKDDQLATGDPRLHRFDGRTVTMGVWAWTSTASTARIQLQDGGGTSPTSTYSSYHTGSSGWEWLEITKTFNVDAAERYIYLRADVNGSTIYYSQPMLVFGKSIGEGNYTRPQGEVVQCETNIVVASNITVSSNADYLLEIQSSGKLPKSIQALYMRGMQVPTSAGDYFGLLHASGWQHLTYSPTTNKETWNARVIVDYDGTSPKIDVQRSATFTDVYIDVQSVVLP